MDGFQLLDGGNKGYLDAHDVQQLAEAASGEAISTNRASQMIAYFGRGDKQQSNATLDAEDFRKIFSPSDP